MSKRTVELELATPGLDARGQPVRVAVGVAAAPGASDVGPPEPDLPGEHMLISLGPQLPATPGVLRLVVELDGETVVRVIPHLGYLHSGFEKLGEYRHYNQIIPLTDRTDYLRSEEHTSELQSPCNLVCRLLLEKKKKKRTETTAAWSSA